LFELNGFFILCYCFAGKMKRLELTSFYLKLNELKEYDQAKQERVDAAAATKDSATQVIPESQPEKINTRTTKTKQEIHARIGLNSNESS
jgi:hypothetical protein